MAVSVGFSYFSLETRNIDILAIVSSETRTAKRLAACTTQAASRRFTSDTGIEELLKSRNGSCLVPPYP